MVVLTNGLKDSDGERIIKQLQYSLVQSTEGLNPESTAAGLEPVRKLVNATCYSL